MPGPTNPYIYKPNDDPIGLANQFGVTPQQLLAANPGGIPFSIGQTINVPFQYKAPTPTIQYKAPIGPQPAGTRPPPAGYGPNYAPNLPRRGDYPDAAARSPALSPLFQDRVIGGIANNPATLSALTAGQQADVQRILASTSSYGGGGTGTGGPKAFDPTKPYGGFTNNDRDNTDYMNTKAAQYYAAAGTPFLEQKRWDAKKKKYISIRQWLKQSKRGGKGRGSGRRDQPQQQQQQEYTLANSLIDFSVSAG